MKYEVSGLLSYASVSKLISQEVTMRAVVYKGPFKVAIEQVENPKIQHPNDVIVHITSSAICGSDLHMYEGRTDFPQGGVGPARRAAGWECDLVSRFWGAFRRRCRIGPVVFVAVVEPPSGGRAKAGE